jgi:hypothetical protein
MPQAVRVTARHILQTPETGLGETRRAQGYRLQNSFVTEYYGLGYSINPLGIDGRRGGEYMKWHY